MKVPALIHGTFWRLTAKRRAPLMTRVPPAVDRALIRRALSKDQVALDALLEVIIPALYLRVGAVLRRRASAARGRDVQQEVEDVVQDVLLRIFADGGKVLCDWDPDRGLSLDRFVGLVAERYIASIMRSQRRNPWTEDPTLANLLSERVDEAPTAELRLANREICERVLDRLRERLSPLGLHLFYALIVEDRAIAVISAETKLAPGALYNWRNRLLRLVHQIAQELEQESEAER